MTKSHNRRLVLVVLSEQEGSQNSVESFSVQIYDSGGSVVQESEDHGVLIVSGGLPEIRGFARAAGARIYTERSNRRLETLAKRCSTFASMVRYYRAVLRAKNAPPATAEEARRLQEAVHRGA